MPTFAVRQDAPHVQRETRVVGTSCITSAGMHFSVDGWSEALCSWRIAVPSGVQRCDCRPRRTCVGRDSLANSISSDGSEEMRAALKKTRACAAASPPSCDETGSEATGEWQCLQRITFILPSGPVQFTVWHLTLVCRIRSKTGCVAVATCAHTAAQKE